MIVEVSYLYLSRQYQSKRVLHRENFRLRVECPGSQFHHGLNTNDVMIIRANTEGYDRLS